MEHAIVATMTSTGIALVFASFALELRYHPMARKDAERLLAILGFASNPLLWRSLRAIPAAYLGGRILMHVLWMFAWGCRCEERHLTLPTRDSPPHRRWIPVLMATIALSELAIFAGSCEIVAAYAYVACLVAAIAVAYAQEHAISRPHRERELVIFVGACSIGEAVAVAHAPWAAVFAVAFASAAAARLLGGAMRRAIIEDDSGLVRLGEKIYASEGEVRNAQEVLCTPLDEDFLDFCEARDPDGVRVYRDATDREYSALGCNGEMVSARVAARRLGREHWSEYATRKREEREPERAAYDIEAEDRSSSEDGEVIYGSLSEFAPRESPPRDDE